MEWYFTFEDGVYETKIHLPIYVDIFLFTAYFRQVNHQYFENWYQHSGFEDIRIHLYGTDMF